MVPLGGNGLKHGNKLMYYDKLPQTAETTSKQTVCNCQGKI